MNLFSLLKVINYAFQIYQWLLVIYALMSWLPGARDSALGRFIDKMVSPYLDIFDRLIPPIGPISINIIIALFVLNLIQRGLITLLLALLG
ncbi:YggT family protein [Facklamia sp. DSM 111018]|uniref:YggT family protein n=1 Tax=Facklamia lactis TaxID=2749967 RepID=A0ABS0LNI7_9LACT|nr:YggT family protein [Facklamia lactis]MBG9979647.1 YggT family protein [Facklamia lactis]MBG9985673.1 YggT family protein [Facklamia lactis]